MVAMMLIKKDKVAEEEQDEARMLIKKDKNDLHQEDLKVETVKQPEEPKKMLEEVNKEVEMEVKKMTKEEEMDTRTSDKKIEIKEKPSFWPEEWDFSQMTLTSLGGFEDENKPGKDESNQNQMDLTISSLPELTITCLEDSEAESRPGKDETNT